ncbi:hypothetical protein COCSUDRAFT_52274 [Coccomyxa subellipsoidea C-169]|uniref:26S proteasome complex subunit SEM1 n=1 Tax=Coccomyxa subellipsoidea (strain C-169) TaxID=574566 RepID=I0ZAX6_COCSC|nr:hypothetical protein COCSUDRAFT_52274 [Coccomyxa subellipsoidea C-169]EIE27795.1 hypothetical protein COCSUDRAFT_52274 [Coccomyxa subellipsoidea C-169]|eukprot:XP_005652339.1 hypothetical protein COCSUDRAFT_52274 [Coccomyxa subellipsoidea C-169]
MTDKAAASKKKAPEVEATTIEEEDLFEDFALKDEPVGVQEGEKEPELPLWEADWDDEDVGGDFVQQLKAELGRSAKK